MGALTAASAELERANEARSNMLRTLQKAAAAQVKLHLGANIAFGLQKDNF
jgi:hypothetical protein